MLNNFSHDSGIIYTKEDLESVLKDVYKLFCGIEYKIYEFLKKSRIDGYEDKFTKLEDNLEDSDEYKNISSFFGLL